MKSIQNNFYVDDFVKSVEEEDEGVKLAEDLKMLLGTGGFNLTKWVSNSREVMESIPSENHAPKVRDIDLCSEDLPTERTLGILWDVQSDKIGIAVKETDPKPTRRSILSIMSKVYDPLGPTAPFVLEAKKILQDLCKVGISWDEPVPPEHNERWLRWIADLPNLEGVKLNRCYKPENYGKVIDVQLHHFTDASQEGYGTVSYIRFINENQQIHCAFVAAKSRVAPLKTHTIVKMELTAATLGVKQDVTLRRELDMEINKSTFWTDSQTVLKYIRNEKSRYQVFVANRIAIIRDNSHPQQWRYCPTQINPADHASRGLSAQELRSKEDWLSGPAFLQEPEDKWPQSFQDSTEEEGSDLEDVTKSTPVCATDAAESTEATNRLLKYYSDWMKLKRAVVWWTKFKEYLQKKAQERRQTRSRDRSEKDHYRRPGQGRECSP